MDGLFDRMIEAIRGAHRLYLNCFISQLTIRIAECAHKKKAVRVMVISHPLAYIRVTALTTQSQLWNLKSRKVLTILRL